MLSLLLMRKKSEKVKSVNVCETKFFGQCVSAHAQLERAVAGLWLMKVFFFET